MPRLSRPSRAQPQDASTPVYEPVSHPLTPSAQHALRTLSQTHSLSKLQAHIQAANGAITDMAGDINDRLMAKEDFMRRRRARIARLADDDQPDDEPDEQEKQFQGLRDEVQSMTAEMEASTRKLVDVETQTRDMEDALRELADDEIVRGAAPRWGNSNTQPTRRRRRRAARADGEDGGVRDEDDEDEEMLSHAEEGEGVGQDDQEAGLMRVFQKNVQSKKERFDALPKRQK